MFHAVRRATFIIEVPARTSIINARYPFLEQRAQISFDVVADFLFTCAGICRYKSLMVGRINQSTALTQRER